MFRPALAFSAIARAGSSRTYSATLTEPTSARFIVDGQALPASELEHCNVSAKRQPPPARAAQ